MRAGKAVFGVVAAVLLAVSVSAQGRNFSGRWTVDNAKSGATPGMSEGRQASDFNIKMDAKTFTVTTTRGGVDTVMIYNMDGSDSKNTPAGRGQAQRAYNLTWDGDKAVVKSKTEAGEEKAEFWLEGESLVRVVASPGRPGVEASNIKTYFKRAK